MLQVGLGDLSPTKQLTRIVAVIVLPFGLIIFAFVMALTAAQAHSHLMAEKEDEDEERGNNIKLHKVFRHTTKFYQSPNPLRNPVFTGDFFYFDSVRREIIGLGCSKLGLKVF